MDPTKQKEIAAKGGRAAHKKGTAHEWTSGEAKEAGVKGGEATRDGHSSSYYSEIGSLPRKPKMAL